VKSRVPALYAELNIEIAALFCAIQRGPKLGRVVRKDILLPLLEIGRRTLGVKTKESGGGRAPFPFFGIEVVLERADPARRLRETQPIYPPAEPGALGCEPLKAAGRGR
jgi:hypothetical protein